MYQIDNSTAASTQPAPTAPGTAGFFTDGSAGGGQAPTIVPAEWLNAVMMELVNVVQAGGLSLSKSTFTQVRDAIKAMGQAGSTNYAVDTGSANVYAVGYAPAVTALIDGLKLRFKAKTSNTGASTFSPNGLTAEPILGAAHQALQGGEIVANGDIELVWNSTLSSWVLLEQTGGAFQVAPATAPNHAMQYQQAAGRLLNVQYITASGTYTPTSGTNAIIVEAIGGSGGTGGVAATTSSTSGLSSPSAVGAYAMARYTTGFSGGVTVTIGAGGIAGTTSSAGGTGGTTSFGSLLVCPGGGGSPAGTVGSGAFTTGSAITAAAPTGSGIISSMSGMTAKTGMQVAVATATNFNGYDVPIMSGSLAGAAVSGVYQPQSSAASAGFPGHAGAVRIWEYA